MPDVMLITEVIPKKQINPITDALLKIDGYQLYTNFDINESNLGVAGIRGVAVYYKDSLKVEEVKFDNVEYQDHVWIEISTNKGLLLCGCIYRTQSNDTDLDGCANSTEGITELIRSACQRNSNLIICGDFNYKYIDWQHEHPLKDHQHLFIFLETIQECFFFQHVTEPTRYRDGDQPNTLDLIFSTEEGTVQNLEYHPPLGESDHVCLTFTVMQTQCINAKDTTEISFNIHKTNYDWVRNDLQQYNWHEKLCSNFEKDYDTFFNILQLSLEKNSPRRKNAVKKRNMFMNNEAMRLRAAKIRHWRRYVATKSPHDKIKYNRSKNKLRTLTRKLRNDYEITLASNIKDRPKSFWKYAKSRLKTRATIPTLKKPDGSKATIPKEKANVLNDYFESVFTVENKDNVPRIRCHNVQDLASVDITPESVKQKLTALNPNKSPGYDKWHPYF